MIHLTRSSEIFLIRVKKFVEIALDIRATPRPAEIFTDCTLSSAVCACFVVMTAGIYNELLVTKVIVTRRICALTSVTLLQ